MTMVMSPFALASNNNRRKKVLVLGAGMAGLSAAYELKHAGHEVSILEARNRVGDAYTRCASRSRTDYMQKLARCASPLCIRSRGAMWTTWIKT